MARSLFLFVPAWGSDQSNVIQANVMLAYPIDEAETLLESKLSTAKTSLSNCEEDLDFLREQITVCCDGTYSLPWPCYGADIF
jgi:hypothetical protein